MVFDRDIIKDFKVWAKKPKRKPLLVMGARQIGKTTAIKHFGDNQFENVVYINFEKEKDVKQFFESSKAPEKIIKNLALFSGKTITAGKTLLFFDEIQECKDALIALKYFTEEASEYHVIGAGSLLGLSIGNSSSFPVGKVEFLDMYPLSFREYLKEAAPKVFKILESINQEAEIEPISDVFYKELTGLFKEFILFGGMPEVAKTYIETKNVLETQKVQDEILRAYKLDFVKHAPKNTSTKINYVWNSIPSQLAKENKKFLYKAIRTGARAREYEEAIQWLVEAGLVIKTFKVEKAGVPLKAYEDVSSFKLYVFETGLLIRMVNLDPTTFINGNKFFTEFKGAIAENYVSQILKKCFGREQHYWASAGKAEVDFLIELSGNVIPLEVKSGGQTKAKSLAVFKQKYSPKLKIRVSPLNLSISDDLLNIPIFLADDIKRISSKLL